MRKKPEGEKIPIRLLSGSAAVISAHFPFT
jgi:hypothetical protein